MLISVRKPVKGITALQTPNKIYLKNTNVNFALQAIPHPGIVRETFFLNQLHNSGHNVGLPESQHDYIVDEKFIFELDEKNKKCITSEDTSALFSNFSLNNNFKCEKYLLLLLKN